MQFMQHFIKHVRPSKDAPVLPLLSNFSAQVCLQVINLPKEKEILLVSFPPHTSHKLQPVDVSVYGSLKKYISAAQDAWIKNNPGKWKTIYDLPSVARKALAKANAPTNVISGF